MRNIALILADNIESAIQVLNHESLDVDGSAFITHPSYLDHTQVAPNEKIYLASDASADLLLALLNRANADLLPGERLNLTMVAVN